MVAFVFLPLLLAAESASTCAEISRANLAACVVGSSPELAESRAAVKAAEGRATAAKRILPSNPSISFSAARRDGTGADSGRSATNLYGALSQEIEIAGQRGKRMEATSLGLEAEKLRLQAAQRDVISRAWSAYFRGLAATARAELAARLERVASDVALVVKAQADKGVLAPIDAQVAAASAVQFQKQRLDAEREKQAMLAELAAILGRDPLQQAVTLTGDLAPLSSASSVAEKNGAVAAEDRPEVQAAEKERSAGEARASVLRRERVPNPSLSFMLQNDGFNERVIGGGIGVSIPLPWPLGKTNAGEIAEAEAETAQAQARHQMATRAAQVELVQAVSAFQTHRLALERFAPSAVQETEATLQSLAKAVESGRLAVRDAVVSRQTLIEFLETFLETRLAVALASVELVRVAGASLEGAAQ